MATFNKRATTKTRLAKSNATKNHAGGLAFRQSAKTELMLRAVTALMHTDKYYQHASDADSELDRIVTEVLRKDPVFVLKLAYFCRTEMHLRSLPIWLLARYATSGVHVPNTRHYVADTVQRADEITELIAACFDATQDPDSNTHRLPIFVKNGLKEAFNKFDAYQFAKYEREGEVKLRDAIFLCHPKAKDKEQQKIFDQIVHDTLQPAQTWEVATTTKGSTKEVWDEIVPRMGHMAILRQLRTLLSVGANLDPVIEKLTNKEAVLHGKQFPFRYLTAFRVVDAVPGKYIGDINSYLDGIGSVKDALQVAMDISVANVPKLTGRTLILIDNSGSMSSKSINKHPNKKLSDEDLSIKAADIASLFGAMSATVCERYAVHVFGERHKHVAVSLRDGLLTSAEKIRHTDVGHATYAHLPIIEALEKGLVYDRIIIFSDMQCYDEPCSTNTKYRSVAEAFMEYQKKVNPKAYLHCVDLTGYGTTLLPQNARNVCVIGGWTDRIFEFITMFESNTQTLVEYIEAYPKKQ